MSGKTFFMALILWLLALDACEPIMVSFGTSKGPIIPKEKQPPQIYIQPKTIEVRSPAPVSEIQEDIPNPNQYQPLYPHQYRTKLYSFKPNPNLILGTPLDQKYTPNLQKYNLYRKQYSRSLGLDYTGPHTFDRQDYELFDFKKTTLKPSVQYSEKDLQYKLNENQQNKYVPEIGVVYSAGVRYYVPQIVYITPNSEAGEEENSVYDKHDQKYFVYNGQQ